MCLLHSSIARGRLASISVTSTDLFYRVKGHENWTKQKHTACPSTSWLKFYLCSCTTTIFKRPISFTLSRNFLFKFIALQSGITDFLNSRISA